MDPLTSCFFGIEDDPAALAAFELATAANLRLLLDRNDVEAATAGSVGLHRSERRALLAQPHAVVESGGGRIDSLCVVFTAVAETGEFLFEGTTGGEQLFFFRFHLTLQPGQLFFHLVE